MIIGGDSRKNLVQSNNQQLGDKNNTKDSQYAFFLFINSGSGAGLGTKLVSQEIRHIQFQIPIQNQNDMRTVEVYFIDMRKNKEFGFNRLKKTSKTGTKTFAIVVGGDGTIMWIISQFVKFDINPLDIPIGIIPTGTGNDFSRTLQWGSQKTTLIQNNFKSLKKLIRKWIHAKQSQFDVWQVTAQVFQNGKFQKNENNQNVILKQKIIQKSFVNYFSFGIDGKIGYSFEKHRTSTRLGNLAMYAVLGIVKQISATKTIDQLIQSFYIHSKVKNQQTCIFKSRFKSQPFQQKTQYITPGLQNIVALNIDSYTGGVSQIWNSAKQLTEGQYQRSPPAFNDNKIQIVSFGSAMAIAMQRSIGGFATRIAQDQGPFIFNFRQFPEEQKHRTYLQIDGQFIRFTHPKRVTIQKSKLINQGRIKVLVNDPSFQPYIPID